VLTFECPENLLEILTNCKATVIDHNNQAHTPQHPPSSKHSTNSQPQSLFTLNPAPTLKPDKTIVIVSDRSAKGEQLWSGFLITRLDVIADTIDMIHSTQPIFH
jgi:hypothetical protein